MEAMNYNKTGEMIIDSMLKQGREDEIYRELEVIRKLLQNKSNHIFKVSELYGKKWTPISDGEKRNLGKRFKAYVKLGWIDNVTIYENSKSKTLVYKTLVYTKAEAWNNMHEESKIA